MRPRNPNPSHQRKPSQVSMLYDAVKLQSIFQKLALRFVPLRSSLHSVDVQLRSVSGGARLHGDYDALSSTIDFQRA